MIYIRHRNKIGISRCSQCKLLRTGSILIGSNSTVLHRVALDKLCQRVIHRNSSLRHTAATDTCYSHPWRNSERKKERRQENPSCAAAKNSLLSSSSTIIAGVQTRAPLEALLRSPSPSLSPLSLLIQIAYKKEFRWDNTLCLFHRRVLCGLS